MEIEIIIIATLLSLSGAIFSFWQIKKDRPHQRVFWLMLAVFVFQIWFLSIRGQSREACPLADWGERLMFLSWSLTFFYLAVGSTYRVSLLGLFTAPVITVMQGGALLPNVLNRNPKVIGVTDYWREAHAALSVLSYGALTLAAVAGVMFLVLNSLLKKQSFTTGLFGKFPPLTTITTSMVRLTWVGVTILTFGVGASFKMEGIESSVHLWVALMSWLSYLVLLIAKATRGMTNLRFSWSVILLLGLSIAAFVSV